MYTVYVNSNHIMVHEVGHCKNEWHKRCWLLLKLEWTCISEIVTLENNLSMNISFCLLKVLLLNCIYNINPMFSQQYLYISPNAYLVMLMFGTGLKYMGNIMTRDDWIMWFLRLWRHCLFVYNSTWMWFVSYIAL